MTDASESPAEPAALVLAVGMPSWQRDELSRMGASVCAVGPGATPDELAGAALGLRTRHPRVPLIVTGPGKLVRRFARRYPALVDIPLADAALDTVQAAIVGP